MTIDYHCELSSSDDSGLNKNNAQAVDYTFADLELAENPSKAKRSKHSYDTKRKIEQLKEDRRLRKLYEDDYWD